MNDAHLPGSETAHLRELLEHRLCALEKLFSERIEHRDIALKLSADEYHRRLDMLNGEADRLHQMQLTYLPRETYETIQKTVDGELAQLRDFRANLTGRLTVVNVIITVVMSLFVSLVMSLIVLK